MTQENFDNEIMEKIKNGEVNMKSRSYFIARAVLFGGGLFLLLAVGVLTVSFLIFSLRASGVWWLPGFGGRGWIDFLIYFPWIIAAFAIAFIFLLEWYVKRYAFAYRQPLLYSVVIVVLLLIAGGWIVHETPLHSWLYGYAQQGRLPFIGTIYRGRFMAPAMDEYIGTITSGQGDSYRLSARNNQLYMVKINPHTRMDEPVSVGSDYVVMGDASGTEITAFGIRKLNTANQFPFRPPHPSEDTKDR